MTEEETGATTRATDLDLVDLLHKRPQEAALITSARHRGVTATNKESKHVRRCESDLKGRRL